MLQVATFSSDDDMNKFLSQVPESNIVNIQFQITSDNQEDYTEYFMVVYRKSQ